MAKRLWLLVSLAALMGGSTAAQDVQSVLQRAAAAMGVTNVKSIQYTGTGWQGMVGQNVAPDQDWPRVDLTTYTRTIDFDTMSSKEEYVRVRLKAGHYVRGPKGSRRPSEQKVAGGLQASGRSP